MQLINSGGYPIFLLNLQKYKTESRRNEHSARNKMALGVDAALNCYSAASVVTTQRGHKAHWLSNLSLKVESRD